jgi:Arc/MetJ-type ribon-helix-helix transcriptional regulator
VNSTEAIRLWLLDQGASPDTADRFSASKLADDYVRAAQRALEQDRKDREAMEQPQRATCHKSTVGRRIKRWREKLRGRTYSATNP